MNWIVCEKLDKAYGDRKLLDGADFYLNEGEKVGIIGINGTGKSTFLRMLAGDEEPDGGRITGANGLVTAYLPQHPVFADGADCLSAVLEGHEREDETARNELAVRARTMLTKLSVDNLEEDVAHLSGGQKKRLALVRTLLSGADVLLLDEPTNHLDNEMTEWLEDFLRKYRGALVMITHDRYFLDSVTERIVELDRGKLCSYACNYSGYLERKAEQEEMLAAAERKRQTLFRTELAWMRRGVRARSTKQKARIGRFEELAEQKGVERKDELTLQSAVSRMGRTTIEMEHVTKGYADEGGNERILIRDFSYAFLKNDRVGFVGSNGCGKTTLFRMLAGEEAPDGGRIVIGQTVKLGYYSQELVGEVWNDSKRRVIDLIRETAEFVDTPEGPVSASVMLERFLFPPEKQYAPIAKLSGGEKRRLNLLRILMEAPNVLLLDEPTNDLDIATLTVLERYLDSFAGIVMIVSHDRYFLDRTVSHLFAYEADGRLRHFMGGYTEYRNCVQAEREATGGSNGANNAGGGGAGAKNPGGGTGAANAESGKTAESRRSGRASWKAACPTEERPRFSYTEAREYERIDAEIAGLEQELSEVETEMQANASNYGRLSELDDEKGRLEALLEEKMERWMYLNELAEKIAAYEQAKKK